LGRPIRVDPPAASTTPSTRLAAPADEGIFLRFPGPLLGEPEDLI
jgi:hypothetical protein